MSFIESGTPVYPEGKIGEPGYATGATRICQLDGRKNERPPCGGICIAVKWPDGKLSYPCTNHRYKVYDGIQKINGDWVLTSYRQNVRSAS